MDKASVDRQETEEKRGAMLLRMSAPGFAIFMMLMFDTHSKRSIGTGSLLTPPAGTRPNSRPKTQA